MGKKLSKEQIREILGPFASMGSAKSISALERNYLEYRFELEDADWETILTQEKELAEQFSKAIDKIYPRESLFERLRHWGSP